MENTFGSKVTKIIKEWLESEDKDTIIFTDDIAIYEVTEEIATLHSSELSKRDELIEAYKELAKCTKNLLRPGAYLPSPLDVLRDKNKKEQLEKRISELTKELGKKDTITTKDLTDIDQARDEKR